MGEPTDLRVHYRTIFTLEPLRPGFDCAEAAIRLIRSWIKKKEIQKEHIADALARRWFFVGGEWQCKGSSVNVKVEPGDLGLDEPQYWAVRYDEVCGQERHRRWRSDIGLTRSADGSCIVAVRVGHYLTPAFIGEEPEAPEATSPMIVKSLVGDKRWLARSGREPLDVKPTYIATGGFPALAERLADRNRGVPLIVVSSRYDRPEAFALSPEELAWNAAGAATVTVVPSIPDVIQEANYFVPYEYRCLNGLVRVYMPGVDFGSSSDFRRHRFFTADYIDEHGADTVASMIYRGLARRPISTSVEVLDVDDVVLRHHQGERQRLRLELQVAAASDDASARSEWIDFLEEENGRLEVDARNLAGRVEVLELREIELETALETEVRSHETDTGAMQYRVSQAEERLSNAEAELNLAKTAQSVIEGMEAFPRDLPGVLQLISDLYPGQVVILDEAFQSAEGWPFDADRAWRVLKAMATYLPQLHFSSARTDPEREFENLSGYSLALTEGKLTKEMKEAARQRVRLYNGQEVDIIHHVKVGSSKPNLLRVHYYPDHENQLIVIGHCGDHLDTAGTRRRR